MSTSIAAIYYNAGQAIWLRMKAKYPEIFCSYAPIAVLALHGVVV